MARSRVDTCLGRVKRCFSHALIFAAPAAYGFPRRRGFQHSDGRRVPRLTRSLSECWKPRQVCPPFPPSRRLFRAFNGRRVPRLTRRLLEGRESRPRVPVPATTPRLHAARRAAPKKPKKKGTLPDALAPLPTELLPIAVMVC